MKKLIVVLLLLVSTAGAADWCSTFSDYRLYVKSALGKEIWDNDGPLSDTIINTKVREAVIFLVPALKARKESYTITTTYAQGTYSLDSESVGVDAVYWSYNDSLKPLLYTPKEQWYQLQVSHINEKRGYEHRAAYYDYSDEKLWVYPVPMKYGGGDTIRVDGWSKIINIAAADSLSTIPQKYRPTVAAYATWRVSLAIGDPREVRFYEDYVAKFNAVTAGGKVATPDN